MVLRDGGAFLRGFAEGVVVGWFGLVVRLLMREVRKARVAGRVVVMLLDCCRVLSLGLGWSRCLYVRFSRVMMAAREVGLLQS